MWDLTLIVAFGSLFLLVIAFIVIVLIIWDILDMKRGDKDGRSDI